MTPRWHRQSQTFSADGRLRGWRDNAAEEWPFARNGYEILPPVPPPVIEKINQHLVGKPTVAEGSLQHYQLADLLSCPEIRELALAPMLYASIWLGVPARIGAVSAWTSSAGTEPELAQVWHRDVDDWRTVKLFCYLTDTGEDNGPHQIIPGSHREEVFTQYGLEPEMYFYGTGRDPVIHAGLEPLPKVQFLGPAGTCFMTNNFIFHRGAPLRSGSRALLQVEFVMTGYGALEDSMRAIRLAWGLER